MITRPDLESKLCELVRCRLPFWRSAIRRRSYHRQNRNARLIRRQRPSLRRRRLHQPQLSRKLNERGSTMTLYGPTNYEIKLSEDRRARLRRLGCAPPQPKTAPTPLARPAQPKVSAPPTQPSYKSSASLTLLPPPTDHRDYEPEEFPRTPMIKVIQHTVCKFYDLTMLELRSERRTANIVRPRQIAMYLTAAMTTYSLPDIGRRFGGFDHTTVLHARNKIKFLIETYPEIAAEVEEITTRVSLIREQRKNDHDRKNIERRAANRDQR